MDRPILCTIPEVQAILAMMAEPSPRRGTLRRHTTSPVARAMVGDELWVREPCITDETVLQKVICYGVEPPEGLPDGTRIRESIHMPRWASRITLEVTRVWVEKMQERTQEQALAEGFSEETWSRNPSVFVVEFEPFLRNIDTR